jgi:hypothetical protein
MKIKNLKILYRGDNFIIMNLKYTNFFGAKKEKDIVNEIKGDFYYWQFFDSGKSLPYSIGRSIQAFVESNCESYVRY